MRSMSRQRGRLTLRCRTRSCCRSRAFSATNSGLLRARSAGARASGAGAAASWRPVCDGERRITQHGRCRARSARDEHAWVAPRRRHGHGAAPVHRPTNGRPRVRARSLPFPLCQPGCANQPRQRCGRRKAPAQGLRPRPPPFRPPPPLRPRVAGRVEFR
jgi:hypothetical protein